MRISVPLLALLVLAALFATSNAVVPTNATSPPSADQFAIDVNPHAAPANTATSVGPINVCVRINENDVLDADEDAIDAIDFDVVAAPGGIPAANPMTGYDYTLGYPTPFVSISSQTPMLITTAAGSTITNNSNSIPDSDGTFVVSVSDSGPIPSSAETGSGVLDRIRLETAPGVSTGAFPLTITGASHTDTAAAQHVPDAIGSALVGINAPSCGPVIDLQLQSQTPTFPIAVTSGADTTLTIDGTVYNDGLDPITGTATVTTTLILPADCTADGQASPVDVTDVIPIPSVWSTEAFQTTAQINCSNVGSYQISSEACVSIFPFFDIVPSNDCLTTVINFDVDPADIKMTNQSVTFPSVIDADVDTTMTIDAVLHNNGPTDPPVDLDVTLTLPSACIADGQSGTVVISDSLLALGVSVSTPAQLTSEINCLQAGSHQITVDGCATAQTPNPDPNLSNNCDTDVVNVDVDTPDTDGDGWTDQAESGAPLCLDGANDDDFDDAVVDDGCPGGPPQAGTYSEAQFNIGTNSLDACGTTVWPGDLVIGGGPLESTDRINILDITGYLAPDRHFETSPGDVNFDSRWDLVPGSGIFPDWINITDLTQLIIVAPPAPPYNGAKAFGGPPCQ